MMQHFDERSWCRDYEQIKQNVLAKRARGTLCQPEDVRELGVLVAVLEKGLASMQAAPMSFEVTQSGGCSLLLSSALHAMCCDSLLFSASNTDCVSHIDSSPHLATLSLSPFSAHPRLDHSQLHTPTPQNSSYILSHMPRPFQSSLAARSSRKISRSKLDS